MSGSHSHIFLRADGELVPIKAETDANNASSDPRGSPSNSLLPSALLFSMLVHIILDHNIVVEYMAHTPTSSINRFFHSIFGSLPLHFDN